MRDGGTYLEGDAALGGRADAHIEEHARIGRLRGEAAATRRGEGSSVGVGASNGSSATHAVGGGLGKARSHVRHSHSAPLAMTSYSAAKPKGTAAQNAAR